MSDIAVKRLAPTTKSEPRRIKIVTGSLKIVKPTMMLVTGSSVLKIEVFSPPMINAPCWKKTTARVVTIKAKSAHKSHP